MANHGKLQLIYIISAPADSVEEGRRLFQSHAKFMKETHHRTGQTALVSYDVSTAPEPADIWNENAGSSGRTLFILNEIYDSKAGVDEHQRLGREIWAEWEPWVAWLGKCEVRGVSSAKISQSLW